MIRSFSKFIETLNESTLMSPLPVFKVTHPFEERRAGGRPHNGVDLATASGTQVSSPADGEVIVANINDNSIKLIVIHILIRCIVSSILNLRFRYAPYIHYKKIGDSHKHRYF